MKYADLQTLLLPFKNSTFEVVWLRAESQYTFVFLGCLIEKIFQEKKQDDKLTMDSELIEAHQAELEAFLSNRWDRIKDTNAAYTQISDLPANQCCLLLAGYLEKRDDVEGRNRYQLLMPTLTVSQEITTLLEFSDPDVEITQYIISDDNTHLIHVGRSLQYAEYDGILKDPTIVLSNGSPRELTDAEKQRVIHHSTESEDYYEELIKRHRYKMGGVTIGSALRILIERLRKGGMHQQGEDYNAGASANEGILEFQQIIDILTEKERERLFRMQNLGQSFRTIWGNIARSHNTDYHNVITCVQLSANKLESLLEKNQELYDISISGKNDNSSTNWLEKLDEQVERAKERFEKCKNPVRSSQYGWPPVISKASIGFALQQLPEETWLDFLARLEDINLQQIIKNNSNLDFVLQWFPKERRLSFLQKLEDGHFKKYIRNGRYLGSVLQQLPEEERLNFLQLLGGDFLREMMSNRGDLHFVLQQLSEKRWSDFIQWLKKVDLLYSMLADKNDLLSLLQQLPAEKRLYFLQRLERGFFGSIITGRYLGSVLQQLPEEERLNFLLALGDVNLLQSVVKCYSYDFNLILRTLPEEERLNFLLVLRDVNLLQSVVEDGLGLNLILQQLPKKERPDFFRWVRGKVSAIPKPKYDLISIVSVFPEKERLPFLLELGNDFLAIIKDHAYGSVFALEELRKKLPREEQLKFILWVRREESPTLSNEFNEISNLLENYIKKQEGLSGTYEHWYDRFFGYSKRQKIEAAKRLMTILSGQTTLADTQIQGILSRGELKSVFQRVLRFLLMAGNTTTFGEEEFVGHLTTIKLKRYLSRTRENREYVRGEQTKAIQEMRNNSRLLEEEQRKTIEKAEKSLLFSCPTGGFWYLPGQTQGQKRLKEFNKGRKESTNHGRTKSGMRGLYAGIRVS